MRGRITTRHLFVHCSLIVHEFGLRCFARAVWCSLTVRRPVTFLECARMVETPRVMRIRHPRSRGVRTGPDRRAQRASYRFSFS